MNLWKFWIPVGRQKTHLLWKAKAIRLHHATFERENGSLATLDCSWWHSRCCSKYLEYQVCPSARHDFIGCIPGPGLLTYICIVSGPPQINLLNTSRSTLRFFCCWKRWLLGPNSSEVGIFSRKIRRKCPSEASRWNRVLDLLSEIPASLQVRLPLALLAIFEAEIERKMGDSDRFIVDLLSNYHDLSVETSRRWAFTQ